MWLDETKKKVICFFLFGMCAKWYWLSESRANLSPCLGFWRCSTCHAALWFRKAAKKMAENQS